MPDKTQILLTSGIFVALSCLPLAGLQIHDYESERHLRFEEGTFPDAPVASQTLWAAGHDFSGVGWSAGDTRKGFALISPRHFVGANHFRPSLGSQVVFRGQDGQTRSYTYAQFYNLKNAENESTDIFIGELSEDIPARDGVALYPVLEAPESELVGRDIVVYGHSGSGPRIGRGEIGLFSNSFGPPLGSGALNDTRNYTFEYFQSTANQDDAYGEVGDSGNPSFIAVDGMLTVAGTHSAVQSLAIITTYDSFLLHYKDQIDGHLEETGHRLILAPIQDSGLTITSVERIGGGIALEIRNPSRIPFDVERTANPGAQTWETVATSETGPTWTGDIPAECDRLFWRLVQYPVALDTR